VNTIEKVLLIGGAGYLAYSSGILKSLFGGAAAAPATSPSTPAMQAPTPTWQLALQAASAAVGNPNPEITFDQWNNYWQGVTGQVPPDPTPYVGAAGSQPRNQQLNVTQWWGYMQQWKPGLQGLRLGPYRATAAFPKSRYTGVPVNPRDPWNGAFL
jgi:hypothetical protein